MHVALRIEASLNEHPLSQEKGLIIRVHVDRFPLPFLLTPRHTAAQSMRPRGRRLPGGSTPLMFVRLLLEVLIDILG